MESAKTIGRKALLGLGASVIEMHHTSVLN